MLVIGLTGGIGSGKSTVASLFKSHGVAVIDADEVARQITETDVSVINKIKAHFGDKIMNHENKINRLLLRKIVFTNNLERKWLENLLHPIIRLKMQEGISKLKTNYVITVIPLLLEVEFYGFINRILVVDTTQQNQITRVKKRDQQSEEEIRNILNIQASREQRVLKAHDIISNDGSLEELEKNVANLHEKYTNLAKKYV